MNPEPDSSARAGRSHERALTCGFSLPLVTARARREPEVAGVMRTQRGPLGFGSPPAGRPDPLLAKPDRPAWSPATAGNGAGRGRCGVVRDCPLETNQDRCEWHGSGTAGEDNVREAWLCRHQLDRRVRLDTGDACLVSMGRRPAAGGRWDLNQGGP